MIYKKGIKILLYYTHEYSQERFETFEEARDDLIPQLDIEEYSSHELFNSYALILQFFRRKSDSAFVEWLENYLDALTMCICDELITEHDDEEE